MQIPKDLNEKTLKAYRIDLWQVTEYIEQYNQELSRAILTDFIKELHKKYKPTKKRVKALRHPILSPIGYTIPKPPAFATKIRPACTPANEPD